MYNKCMQVHASKVKFFEPISEYLVDNLFAY